RKSGNQRLAFAGFHLGNFALVQDHAADELDVEMTLTERALGRFAEGGKGSNQKVIERSAFRGLLLELFGSRFQGFVGKRFQLLLQRVDRLNPRLIAADTPLIRGSKQLAGDSADHSGALLDVGR